MPKHPVVALATAGFVMRGGDPVTVIADRPTREELAEYLANLCAFAKRQPRVVARFADDEPTAWDKAHRRMDGPLDDWLAARG